jgi:hypothetical protein
MEAVKECLEGLAFYIHEVGQSKGKISFNVYFIFSYPSMNHMSIHSRLFILLNENTPYTTLLGDVINYSITKGLSINDIEINYTYYNPIFDSEPA